MSYFFIFLHVWASTLVHATETFVVVVVVVVADFNSVTLCFHF